MKIRFSILYFTINNYNAYIELYLSNFLSYEIILFLFYEMVIPVLSIAATHFVESNCGIFKLTIFNLVDY